MHGELSTEQARVTYAQPIALVCAGLILPVSSTPLVEYFNITDTPNFLTGTKTIQGELISQGIRVQRRRLRDSLKRVDPVGRRLRAMNSCLQRRVYNVRSPLALWHMDGNHKLIRFEVSK